jgi:hypothetical protein
VKLTTISDSEGTNFAEEVRDYLIDLPWPVMRPTDRAPIVIIQAQTPTRKSQRGDIWFNSNENVAALSVSERMRIYDDESWIKST